MKQEQLAKILKAVAILLLCFLFPLRAGANDDFIRGYASAVLEREFQIKKFSLEVSGETVRIKSAELANADHDKLMATLLSIHGVKQVAILDSRGVVVASSTPRQAATQRASRQEPVPEYELGFLPGGNLFESLVADPRWPRGGLQFERPQSFMRKISLLLEYYTVILPTDSFLTQRSNISDRGCTWIFSGLLRGNGADAFARMSNSFGAS